MKGSERRDTVCSLSSCFVLSYLNIKNMEISSGKTWHTVRYYLDVFDVFTRFVRSFKWTRHYNVNMLMGWFILLATATCSIHKDNDVPVK